VLVSGIVLTQYACTDRMAEAHAMVSLVEQGWADQTEVARAFACSARTVRRHQRRFEEGGLGALGHTNGYPAGRARLSDERRRLVQRLKAEGVDQREIARRMGVSEKAIRKLLRRLGWKPTAPTQANLPLDGAETADPNPSASAPPGASSLPTAPPKSADPNLSALGSATQEESILSHDTDPTDRSADRLLARLGLLEDAPPLFGSAIAVPRAGVLLALPALVSSGVFACAQQTYGSLGPAFYGLRTSLLTLLLMALWRIKRPEGLKEHSPQDLGRVLGLDRDPRSRRCVANWLPSRRPGRPPSSAARWPNNVSPCAGPSWVFSTLTATCGFTTGNIGCPRPMWPACASRCRPLRITGSTIWPGIHCLSSPPMPTPAW